MSLAFRVVPTRRIKAVVVLGPEGPAGADGSAAPIPSNTALLNNTGASALPTAQGQSSWVAWLGVSLNTHSHGNIDAAGRIGSTPNLPLITSASGVITVGSFGSTANSFCQGNDSRLSNARDWIASTVTQLDAELGLSQVRTAWTAERVRQAIVGWWTAVSDERLGNVYDFAEGMPALLCADFEWSFGSAIHGDNLRIALNAVETFTNTIVTGGLNRFQVLKPTSGTQYAELFFNSHSGPGSGNLGQTQFVVDAETGFDLNTQGGQLSFAAGSNTFNVSSDAYSLSHPNRFRQAIGVNTGVIQFDLDGDGSVLTVGVLKGQVRVPFNCSITSWELVSNETGSIVVDIEKDSYANFPPTTADSITGSSRPTISASNKAQSSLLTGWATSLNEGDYLKIEVISVSSITNATLTLRVTRT